MGGAGRPIASASTASEATDSAPRSTWTPGSSQRLAVTARNEVTNARTTPRTHAQVGRHSAS